MGRDYYAKKKGVEEFSVNFSGAMLLGWIHEWTDALRSERWPAYDKMTASSQACEAQDANYEQFMAAGKYAEATTCFHPSPLFSATAEQAKQAAATIRANKDKLRRVYDALRELISPDETYEEFLEWVESWCKWLDECGGYEV